MTGFRKHQSEMEAVIDRIISGYSIKRVYIYACPGAGKSAIPISLARLIKHGIIDAIAWIVPRKNLQDQGERGFIDPFFRELYGHNATIRSSTNDSNPCRGTSGFVSTFQALAVDKAKTVEHDFRRKRYALVLDEMHHVWDGSDWYDSVKRLVDLAEIVVFMSGTPDRADGKKIAFAKYIDGWDGKQRLDMAGDESTAVIQYSRADALSERAIIPLSFHMSNGNVQWMNDTGLIIERELSRATRKDASAAIYTALSTEYSEELLIAGAQHWVAHKHENKRSKLLVVTADIGHARKTVAQLKKIGMVCGIATSHSSAAATKAINRFKNTALDILVVIGMCYEGFDCKEVTHIISLTRVRSQPWIEQMVARAVRVDPNAGPYENQIAHIFCPDDPLFREIVKKIEREQAPFVKPQLEKEPRAAKQLGMFGDEFGPMAPGGITPIASSLTGSRGKFLGPGPLPVSATIIPMQTEREKEEALRRQIDQHVKAYARNNQYKPMKINSELKDHFGKSRDEMTRPELERLQAHLNQYYRLNMFRGHSRPAPTKAIRI